LFSPNLTKNIDMKCDYISVLVNVPNMNTQGFDFLQSLFITPYFSLVLRFKNHMVVHMGLQCGFKGCDRCFLWHSLGIFPFLIS
jgi:hypothetical protein